VELEADRTNAGGGSDQRGVGGAGLLLVAALVGLPLVAQRRLGPQLVFASYVAATSAVSQYSPFLRRAVLPLGAWSETHDPPRRLGQRFGALFGASNGPRAVPVAAVLEAKVVAMAVLAALGTLGGPLATSCRAVQYAMAGLQVAGAVGVVLLTPYRVGVQNGGGALSQILTAAAILATAVPELSEDSSLGENLLFALSTVGMMTASGTLLVRVKEALERKKVKQARQNQAAGKLPEDVELSPTLTVPLLSNQAVAHKPADPAGRTSNGIPIVRSASSGSGTTGPPPEQQPHEGHSTRVANPLECHNAGFDQPRDRGNQL
jgi:hypothetical protein